jgi:hypothetical protein
MEATQLIGHAAGTPDSKRLVLDPFITRVVRNAWASACPPGDQHDQSTRVRRRPVVCRANVTQLDTHPIRMLSNWPGQAVGRLHSQLH